MVKLVENSPREEPEEVINKTPELRLASEHEGSYTLTNIKIDQQLYGKDMNESAENDPILTTLKDSSQPNLKASTANLGSNFHIRENSPDFEPQFDFQKVVQFSQEFATATVSRG